MQIPKIIWQTSKEPFNELPDYLRTMAQTWQEINPDWEYHYVTNHDAGEWILKTYGAKYKEMYDYIDIPFCKADFWRYLVLRMYGGLYVDIDTVCLQPIESWVDLNSMMNVGEEWFPEFGETTYTQWLIATTPGNKFMNGMLTEMRIGIASMMEEGSGVTPTQTGPGPWTITLNELNDNDINIIQVPGNVHHYVGNSSWSDVSGHTMESAIWDIKNHDVKILDSGYNSIGDEKLWA